MLVFAAGSRLYRRRFLHPTPNPSTFFGVYTMCILVALRAGSMAGLLFGSERPATLYSFYRIPLISNWLGFLMQVRIFSIQLGFLNSVRIFSCRLGFLMHPRRGAAEVS